MTHLGHRSACAGKRGFIALLVLLFVTFFGVLAGLQSLTLLGLCGAGRGFDAGFERLLLERQLQCAVEESVLQQWEGRHESPRGFEADLTACLARLAPPGVSLSSESPVVGPSLTPDFIEGGPSLTTVHPTEQLLSRCGPELRRLCGTLVSEGPVTALAVRVEGLPWPGHDTESLKFEYSTLRVPVLALGALAYDLPDELGRPVPGASPMSLTGGLARDRDAARRGDLVGSGSGLPFQFRRRASIAAALARVFSKDFVDSAARLAGPCLLHRLDLPQAETALLQGLTRNTEGACLDLSLAGQGSFAGLSRSGVLLVLASSLPGQVLRLQDSGPDSQLPLVLLVVGNGTQEVQLGDCRRPVLLIASKVDIRPLGGVWAGGLMLGPGCRVLSGSGPVDLSSLAYHAGDGAGAELWFRPLRAPNPQLAALSPTVVFVNTRIVSNEH